MTNLNSKLKSTDITLPPKLCIVKAMVFLVVMDMRVGPLKRLSTKELVLFELWFWIRLLRVTWRAKRSNQSILKLINTEYPLKGLMLNLKLQYFGWFVGKYPNAGKIEGRRRGWQRMRWLKGITDPMAMSLSKLRKIGKSGTLDRCQTGKSAVHEVAKSWTWFQ